MKSESEREREINEEIGVRLKKIRGIFLLTQSGMSRILNISTSHYSRMERGLAFPGADRIKRLKETLDINPDWLFSGSGELFSPGFFNRQFNEKGSDKESAKPVETVTEIERIQIQDLFYFISEDRVAYHNIMEHFFKLRDSILL